MTKKSFKRVIRPATADEKKRHAEIRAQVMAEFPPSRGAHKREPPPGIPAQIRAAREAQGLTWYTLAKRAGIPNPNTVRDIESGHDAKLSNVQAVATVLDLRLELVEAHGTLRVHVSSAQEAQNKHPHRGRPWQGEPEPWLMEAGSRRAA